MRRVWLAAVLVAGAACASAPVKVDLSGLAEADQKVLEGCYDCLLDARAIYRRVAVGRARPQVVDRLFETNLLIALREKELALDPSAAMAEARQVAAELLPGNEASRHLAIVEAVPADDMGVPRSEMQAFRRAKAPFVPQINDELAWLEGSRLQPVVRQYLAIALDCAYPTRQRPEGAQMQQPGPREAAPGAPPILIYRTAICGILSQPALYRLRAANERFAEASYYLARFDVAVARQNGPGRARERLADAIARFPASPSVTYLSGSFHQLVGNCEQALRAYDATLALAPVHENAWLGRTICLTYLKRSEEAIDTATRMISLDTDNKAQAYYWRAWNRHVRKELAPARVDITTAKSLAFTNEIHTLAGIIEYDQGDLDPAEHDLTTARTMPGGARNCTAMWYLGLVHIKRTAWLNSARQFESAMTCYEHTADYAQAELRGLQARPDLDAEYRTMQVAALETAMREATSQRYAAAFNAANYFASGRDIAAARRLIDIAAADPVLADRVAKLREWLKDK